MSPAAAVEMQSPMTSSSLQNLQFSFASEMEGDRPVNTTGSRRRKPRLAKVRKQSRRESGAESSPFGSKAAAPVNTSSSCNASFCNGVSDDATLSNDSSFAFTCKKETMNFNDECEATKGESGSVDEEKAKTKSGGFTFEFQDECKVNSGVFGTSWRKESGSAAINGETVVDDLEKMEVEMESFRCNSNGNNIRGGSGTDNVAFDVQNEDSKCGFGNVATSATTDQPVFKLPDEMEKLNINECGGGGEKKKDSSVNLNASAGASFVFRSSAKPASSSSGSSEHIQEQKTDSAAASVEGLFVDSFGIDNNDRIRHSASCGNSNSKSFTFQAGVDKSCSCKINSDMQTNVAASVASFDSQPSDNGASMVGGGQRKDESCPSTPVGSGVSFTEFITPNWDQSSFKANLYSEVNKKNVDFNVKGRSKKDKRLNRTRGNFKQSSLRKQQWQKQNPKSPECYSPMDFSPYMDTPVADHPSGETCVTSNDSFHPDNNSKVENLDTAERTDTSIGDQKSGEPKEESLHPDGECPLKSYIFGTATAYSSCKKEEACDNIGATMASARDGEVLNEVSHESVQHCFAQDRKYFSFSASSSAEGNLPSRKILLRKKSKNKVGKVGSSSVAFPPHASTLLINTVHGQEKDKCSSESILKNKSEAAEQVVKSPVSSSAAFEEACKTWRFRGNQAYKSGHMSKAEDFYTQGINSVPLKETEGCCIKPLVICYSNRAAARISLGRIREALEDCLMAVAMDPNFLKVYVRAANCYLMLGEIENAMQYYNKLLESGANMCLDRRITIEAADGLQKAQKVAECTNRSAELLEHKTLEAASVALEIITEGLSTSSCSEKLLEMKAEALCLLRKYEEAIQLCEQTLCIAEKNFPSVGTDNCSMNMNASGRVNYPLARLWRWRLMSKSYFCMGKLEAALDLLQKLEQVGPMSNKQGKEILESSISLAATIRELLRCKNAGNEAFRSGKYTEAVEYYTVALSSNVESRPFAAICFCNRAAAHQALGHIADAIADCSLSMALDGNYSKAIVNQTARALEQAVSRRAVLHEMIRDYAQAASDLQRLISILQNRSDEKAKQSGSPGRSAGSKELKQACRRMSLMEEEAKQGVPLDFYLILGVKASDAASDIKKAYRKAALRHHPDKASQFLAKTESGEEGRLWKEIANEVHKDADRLFKMIGEAYAILSDTTKRTDYDHEEEMRKATKEIHQSSSYGRTSDAFSSYTFRRSGNKQNWHENWRTYGNSHSRW